MLFYCGNQWGYTPVGKILNIPAAFCNPPTGLTVSIYAQYATVQWLAPHDYLKFVLEYRIVGSPTWTTVDVFGQTYVLTLTPMANYEWRVKTVCATAPLRESTYAVGPVFLTHNSVTSCTPVAAVQVIYLGDRYRLQWAATGASFYTVEIKMASSPLVRTYTTQDNFFEIYTLTPGEVYMARVIANCQNVTQQPIPSPWVSWTVANLTCPSPGTVNSTKGTNSIVIGWGSAGIGYTYNVYLNNVPAIIGYPGTTWTFNGLTPGTDYNIKVVTNCSDGLSPAQEINVKTDLPVCSPPTALQVVPASIAPTGFDITWTPALGIVSQQIILNNGTPESVGAAIATKSFTNLPGGSNNTVVVRSVCTGNVSSDATVSQQLTGCAPPTGLVLTPASTSLVIAWTPVANAVKYRVKVTRNVGNIVAFSTSVFTNTVTVTGLIAGFSYTVEVITECAAGELSTALTGMTTMLANPTCENAQLGAIALTPTTISFSFSFTSGVTTGFFTVGLRKASDNSIVEMRNMNTLIPQTFTGLLPATGYKIYAYRTPTADPTSCIPVENITVTTSAACEPPTNVVATMLTNDTQIQVSLTASVSAPPTYQLEFQAYGDTTWISMGAIPALSFPTNIGPVAPGRYRVRVSSNCTASQSIWVESNYACPKPQNVVAQPVGNGVHIQWDPIVGINSYAVYLTRQLDGAVNTYSTPTNSIDISNLLPGASYSFIVTAICDDAAGTGLSSTPQTFTTSAEPPGRIQGCLDPVFTAIVQDCEITDPGGVGGGGGDGGVDGGGGGGGVGADCSVTQQDWTLINALFAAVADDAPNDTFLEATFEIAQSIANGVLAAMPGGIMGVINAACLPASTANVSLEVVLGGNLEVGNGTYATNGNITVAASYTSDGSTRLVVRLRGNYNKV